MGRQTTKSHAAGAKEGAGKEPTADLHGFLKHYFGFDTFKGNQEDIIRNLMAGRDTFVLMPTGGGKSLCYQLPALLLEGCAIIVSPLIALMKNQVDALSQTCEQEGMAHFMNSTLSKAELEEVRKDVLEGKCKLLYVAPETMTKEDNLPFFRAVKISFYAIDEAHCISEWGHDFRVEYRRLRPTMESIGLHPIIALTATATNKVKQDIKKNLGIVDAEEFCSSFNRPNLYYEVKRKTKLINKQIIIYIRNNPGKSGIIYCLSRKTVETLAKILQANNIAAAPYHAGLDSATRSRTQDDFLSERIQVMVATIAFGMGIDKPDVRFVIHYDMPKSLEGYYQETGRAGRDGGEGKCIAFYSPKDIQRLQKFMESKPLSEQDIGRQLLQETANYAESGTCRRKLLLHYFGERYDEDNCHNCDNCLHPRQRVDATKELLLLLHTVQEIGGNFDLSYMLDLLMGNATEDILRHKHDELDTFGIAAESDVAVKEGSDSDDESNIEKFWKAVIRTATLEGYLLKDIERSGALRLNKAGKELLGSEGVEDWLKKRLSDNETQETNVPESMKSFIVTLEMSQGEGENDGDGEEGEVMLQSYSSEGAEALDQELFIQLKRLRKDVAQKMKLPPYVIFQDQSLQAMATIYPQTEEEMLGIPGVGAGKTRRYAAPFLELINDYCRANEIERPQDLRVKTVPGRSQQKLTILSAIDRHVALDDIAELVGIDFTELLDEIDSIVDSGTKLKIDYFLDETVDPSKQEEIEEYFRKAETPNIEKAVATLGDDFSEEEIRLVRIKFVSDNAN